MFPENEKTGLTCTNEELNARIVILSMRLQDAAKLIYVLVDDNHALQDNVSGVNTVVSETSLEINNLREALVANIENYHRL